jgi:hypothetical protein
MRVTFGPGRYGKIGSTFEASHTGRFAGRTFTMAGRVWACPGLTDVEDRVTLHSDIFEAQAFN